MMEKRRYLPIAAIAAVALVAAACSSGSDAPTTMPPPDEETMPMEPSPEIDAEAKLLAASIGPDGIKASADGVVDENDSNNTLPVTITAGKLTDATPDDDTDDFAEQDSGSWVADYNGVRYSWSYQDRTTEGDMEPTVVDSILSYTTQEDPEDEAYTVYYADDATFADRPGVASATEAGVLTLDYSTSLSAFLPLVSVADFPTVRNQTLTFEDDGDTDMVDEGELDGTFHGVPGTFACDATCTVRTGDDAMIDQVTGDWTFTPTVAEGGDIDDIIVAGAVPDTDYMDFGYWHQRTTDTDGEATVRVLAYAHSPTANDYGGTGALEDSAEYAGEAVGQYMKKTFDPATGGPIGVGYGHFNAYAELTAYFGGDNVTPANEDRVEGTVSYFRDRHGNMIDQDWVLHLVKSAIGSTDGTFSGTTMADVDDDMMADSDEGTFEGTFHGPTAEVEGVTPMPSSASGTFDGHFRNGHVYGAFATTLEE